MNINNAVKGGGGESAERVRKENVRFLSMLPVIIMLILTSGCYGKITGTVVDAETGKPIEGAVVLAEWTKTHGIGDHHTESFKVIETLTDKEGKVTIEGVYGIIVDPPGVTVYKKGYVAWNNERIFPEYKKRSDFKWKKGNVIKLEKFKDVYSRDKHVSFIRTAINSTIGYEKKRMMRDAFDWETDLAREEIKLRK